jgi:hypothetical protein
MAGRDSESYEWKMEPAETKNVLQDFLLRFRDLRLPQGKQYKYVQALHAINSRRSRVLTIEIDDLTTYSKDNVECQRTTPLTCINFPFSPL